MPKFWKLSERLALNQGSTKKINIFSSISFLLFLDPESENRDPGSRIKNRCGKHLAVLGRPIIIHWQE
jgi:hypothetical protein